MDSVFFLVTDDIKDRNSFILDTLLHSCLAVRQVAAFILLNASEEDDKRRR